MDDPPSNGGYGDTEALKFDKPMYTVERNRVGVHDAPNGQLRFMMLKGSMSRTEASSIQRNLNASQALFLKPKEPGR